VIKNKNKFIIDFDEEYILTFLEEEYIDATSPVSEYYLKLDDLSINLLISLKWIIWGFIFLDSISKEILKTKEELSLENLIENSINKSKDLKLIKDQEHELIIDDQIIYSKKDFENLIENFYNWEIFDENTKVHMKLKINLREFLIISHMYKPAFMKFK
jgi:hypothetical protein